MPNCAECKHYIDDKCEYSVDPSWSCHFEYAEDIPQDKVMELKRMELKKEEKRLKAERREECKKGWIRD